jgi:diguanylate cyclase (GGDEF)-like protein/PAS domain S-box-containing protein
MHQRKKLKFSIVWGRYTWIALGLATVFWLADSSIDAFLFEDSNLVVELWPDDSKELWMRLLVVGLALVFGAYAQASISRMEKVQDRLYLSSRIFHSAGEAIMVTDTSNRIVDVNKAFESITGYRRTEILGKNPRMLQSGRHDQQFYQDMWATLNESDQWEGEIWDRRASGEVYPKWLTITALRNRQGKVTNHVAVFRDISAVKEAENRLHHIAHHDSLTGLDNRAQLHINLKKTIDHASRHERQIGLLFIDLDHFKDINDMLGHTIGDQVLQEAARRLGDCVRSSDIVARLGGDEFVIVLDELPSENIATDIAGKIIDFFGQPFLIQKHELYVTPSIGISIYPGDGQSADELLKNADVAMYHAKDSGRNNYQFFSQQLNDNTAYRFKLLTALRYAIDNQGFELYYQPQIDFVSGQICGVEALIRWHDRELGQVAPDDFIPLCEETGLIQEVDDWVLLEACKQYCSWEAEGCAPPSIAVNISAREIKQSRFIDRVERTISVTGMDPRHLDLEITEHLLVEQDPVVMQILERLRKLGITLSMDDFGTGYSSLSYLKRLPFDVIKVDRSFVSDIPYDQDDTAITAAIIAMAHSLRLRVVAEGVETEEQIEYLRQQQCDMGQGYIFCRPVPADQLTKLLIEQPDLVKLV